MQGHLDVEVAPEYNSRVLPPLRDTSALRRVIYNEIEPFPAQWLRNLVVGGHIARGVVDTRSIAHIQPEDVKDAIQFHTFAGIGVWSYALRLAGWPDDRPVWTGSCPCQPFSQAGRREGVADPRHLWPAWFRLIEQCRPPVVFGEQVASPDGRAWLDAVYADLEGAGYAVGAAVLPAAGVGAPHGRHRIFFVGRHRERGGSEPAHGVARPAGPRGVGLADAHSLSGRQRGAVIGGGYSGSNEGSRAGSGSGGVSGVGLADAHEEGLRQHREYAGAHGDAPSGCDAHGRGEARPATGVVGDAGGYGGRQHAGELHGDEGEHEVWRADSHHASFASSPARPPANPWEPCDWVDCRDGKKRPVEPGTFPLADGAPQRVGRLRGYGNAIVAEVAATFIRAYMDTESAPE